MSLDAMSILLTHMRDATRNVDPKLFKSEQHRQQILDLFLNVLKEIDDKLDSADESEEEEIKVNNLLPPSIKKGEQT